MPVKVCCDTIDFYGLKTPFRAGCFGSSRTGKTTSIFKFLDSELIDQKFQNIYFCSPNLSKHPDSWEDKIEANFTYLNKIPDRSFFENIELDSLIIIEDFWLEACKSEEISNLFKVYSGKLNLSIFITCQNPFEGKYSKTIRNNINYFLLFKNLGDVNINRNLTKQLGLYNEYKMAVERSNAYDFALINMNLASELPQTVLFNVFAKQPTLFNKS